MSHEGTYTVDGMSFTIKMKMNDMEESKKITINKIYRVGTRNGRL